MKWWFRQGFAQEALELIVRGLRHAERVARIARPVVSLLDGQFADALEQGLIGRSCHIHLLPFRTDADESRPRHRVPLAELALVEIRLGRKRVRGVFALRHGHGVREIRIVLRRDPCLERLSVRLRQFRREQGHIVAFLPRDIPAAAFPSRASHRAPAASIADSDTRLQLFLFVFRLAHAMNLREVEALERVPVHGHE